MSAGYRLPNPQWEGELRKCVQCGLIDSPVYAGQADESGAPMFVHKVVIDVVFTKTEVLTKRDRDEGFLMMKLENRPAKARAICRECLEADEQTKSVWQDFDKTRKELAEQTKEPSWYAVLCQE